MKNRLFLILIVTVFLSSLNGSPTIQNKTTNPEGESFAKKVKPYIIFPGNCKEVLLFYKECLDGEIIMLQTFEDSRSDFPEEYNGLVFNSEFKAAGIRFMASDNLPTQEIKIGNNFALFVTVKDPAELKLAFEKLSQGGKILYPLENNFGMLIDKFGIQWMLESKL